MGETILRLGREFMDEGSKIWLPCNGAIETMVEDNRINLEKEFLIERVADPNANPLYFATELVTESLMLFPDKLVNANQIVNLNDATPFILMTKKSHGVDAGIKMMTCSKKRKVDEGVL